MTSRAFQRPAPTGAPSPTVMRVLLVAILASTCIGLWFATAHRPQFVQAFPGARHAAVYRALLATGAGGLVALWGLWRWRRWGVVLYGCVAAVSLGLDIVAEAPLAHQGTVVAAALAMAWLVHLHWERFRRRPSRAGAE